MWTVEANGKIVATGNNLQELMETINKLRMDDLINYGASWLHIDADQCKVRVIHPSEIPLT